MTADNDAANQPRLLDPRLAVRPDRRLIRANGRSERFLLVDVVAPTVAPDPTRRRPPVNLGFVLDRSGSMGGQNKLGLARQAVLEAIHRLEDPDRFSVVVYDDQVEVVVEQRRRVRREPDARGRAPEDRRRARLDRPPRRLARRLRAGRRRPLARRRQPRAAAHRRPRERRHHRPRRAPAGSRTTCAGEASRRARSASGPTSTRRLLQGMADAGGGHFYFIGDVAQMRDHITSEVGETLEVVAREVVLELTLPESVRIDSLSPFRVERRGGRVLVYLGDMVSGQMLSIVLRVTFDFGEVGPRGGRRRAGGRPRRRVRARRAGPRPGHGRLDATPTTPRTTPSRATGTWTGSSPACSPSGRSRRPSRSTARASTTRPAGPSRASGSGSPPTPARTPELRKIAAELHEQAPAYAAPMAGDGAQAASLRRQCVAPHADAGREVDAPGVARDPRRHREARLDEPGFTLDARSRARSLWSCNRLPQSMGRRPVEVARRMADTFRMSLDRPAAARLLLRRAAPPAPDGTIVDVTVDSAGWEFADIAVLRLRPGQSVARDGRRPRAARARPRGPRHGARRGPRLRHPGHACVGVRRPACAGRPRRSGSTVRRRRRDRRARRRRIGARADPSA